MPTIVSIELGGTGANSAAAARAALGVSSSVDANAAYEQANTARNTANDAYSQANTARSDANTTFATINTTFGTVNTGISTANTQANDARNQANSAYAQANLAYAAANNGNLLLGGVITGTLNVTQDIIVGGNVYLEGNTTFINVATYAVEDSLIYLASNNQLTDSVDIGFMGGKNTGGTYSHTGLARDATDAKWKLFDGLPEEGHVGNVVDFTNTYLATLVANVEANTLSVVNGVSGNVNFDSGTLFVDSVANKVGIGTTNSFGILSLYGSNPDLVIQSNSGTSDRWRFRANDNDQRFSLVNDVSGYGEVFTILRAGNVGIGTTNPSSKLHILDSTGPVFRMVRTSNRFDVEVDNNAMGFVSRDSATANAYFSGFAGVGIGTTSPIQALHVNGSIYTPSSIFFATGSSTRLSGSGSGELGINFNTAGTSAFMMRIYDVGAPANNNAIFQVARTTGNTKIGYDFTNPNSVSANLHVQTNSDRALHVEGPLSGAVFLTAVNPNIGPNFMRELGLRGENVNIYTGLSEKSNGVVVLSATTAGNIGIRLNNPQTRTHIDLSSGVNGLLIDTTYAGGAGGESVTSTAANTIYNAIFRSAYGTNAASVSNAGHKWGVLFTGYNGSAIGASQLQKSAGVFAVSEDPGAGYNRTVGLSLWTAPFDSNITEKVRITGPGNVGIGTTTPSARLHVINSTPNSGQPAILADLNYGNTGDTSTALRLNLNNGAGGGYLSGYGGELVVSHNSEFIAGSGWVARSTTSSQIAQVSGEIIFYNNTGLTAGSTFTRGEKMRILTNGSIGIGTASPAYRVQINRTEPDALGIFRALDVGAVGAAGTYIDLGALSGSTATAGARIVGVLNNPATSGYITFNTLNSSTMGERMIITAAGNVGIGTTNPIAKLHIEGPATTASIGVENVLVLGRPLTSGASFQQSAIFKLGRYAASGGIFEAYTRLDIALKDDTASTDYNTTTTVMTLLNNGRVGIGTTNPTARLHSYSATSTALLLTGDSNNEQLVIQRYTNTNQQLIIGYHSSNYGMIQAVEQGVAFRSLLLNPNGGNISIGTSSAPNKLYVLGSSFAFASTSNGNFRLEGSGGNGLVFGTIDATSTYASWIQSGYVVDFNTARYNLLLQPLGANVGIGTTNPLRPLQVNGIEISISSVGSQAGYTQGAFLSSSGTDSTPSARGQGMFLFNEDNDVTWYLGTNYTSSDVFSINRKASTTSVDTSTAQLTHSLFSILSGGAIGVNFSGLNAAGYGQFAINWNPTNTTNNNGVGLAIRTSTADTDATFALFFNEGGTGIGSIKRTGTTNAVSFNTTSDRRLKENILPADSPSAIIDNIEIVKHDWKDGGHVRYGAVAQDLINIAPEAVSVGDPEEVENPRNPWGVDYSKLVPMLIKEIQELRARVSELENKVG